MTARDTMQTATLREQHLVEGMCCRHAGGRQDRQDRTDGTDGVPGL